MMSKLIHIVLFGFILFLTSCGGGSSVDPVYIEDVNVVDFPVESALETEEERAARLNEEEEERLAREVQAEKNRQEREIYDRYINNSLSTGATPYADVYGGNPSCNDYGCSAIQVTTSNSDVLVTIKKNGEVVRHAYVQSNDSYMFYFPDGTYQAFFYYGNGWNPEKPMKDGQLKGGFISGEIFQKDDPQYLNNQILEYELILQEHGNFSTTPSDSEEAL